MKLLKIENNCGFFKNSRDEFKEIDSLDKEELLALVNLTFQEEDIEFDKYDENLLKNQAHQIIYKSVFNKLENLKIRKKEFKDEAAQLFLIDYTKYRDEPRQ